MVSSVRPVKPPRRHTMVLPPLPIRLAYRRASFIEPSWASAPELAKNVSHTCSPLGGGGSGDDLIFATRPDGVGQDAGRHRDRRLPAWTAAPRLGRDARCSNSWTHEQPLRLVAHRLDERGVPMAQAAHADTCEKVRILTAIVTDERHPVAAHEIDCRAAERGHHVGGFQRFLKSERTWVLPFCSNDALLPWGEVRPRRGRRCFLIGARRTA